MFLFVLKHGKNTLELDEKLTSSSSFSALSLRCAELSIIRRSRAAIEFERERIIDCSIIQLGSIILP